MKNKKKLVDELEELKRECEELNKEEEKVEEDFKRLFFL